MGQPHVRGTVGSAGSHPRCGIPARATIALLLVVVTVMCLPTFHLALGLDVIDALDEGIRAPRTLLDSAGDVDVALVGLALLMIAIPSVRTLRAAPVSTRRPPSRPCRHARSRVRIAMLRGDGLEAGCRPESLAARCESAYRDFARTPRSRPLDVLGRGVFCALESITLPRRC